VGEVDTVGAVDLSNVGLSEGALEGFNVEGELEGPDDGCVVG